MAHESVAALLTEALDRLERLPEHASGLADALRGITLGIHVGEERFSLDEDGGRVHVVPPLDTPTLDVRSDRQTLHDLADGDLHLVDVLDDGRLVLRGAPDALDAAGDALAWFLHGSVRIEGFDVLLNRLTEEC